jgi:hypothetical protein
VPVHPPVCQFVFPPVAQVLCTDSSGPALRLCQINTEWRAWPWLGGPVRGWCPGDRCYLPTLWPHVSCAMA